MEVLEVCETSPDEVDYVVLEVGAMGEVKVADPRYLGDWETGVGLHRAKRGAFFNGAGGRRASQAN